MGLCRTLAPAQLCLKQRVTVGTGSALAWGMNSEKTLRPSCSYLQRPQRACGLGAALGFMCSGAPSWRLCL